MSVREVLRHENYDECAFAVEKVFVLEGLDKCIDGSETETPIVEMAQSKIGIDNRPIIVSTREGFQKYSTSMDKSQKLI